MKDGITGSYIAPVDVIAATRSTLALDAVRARETYSDEVRLPWCRARDAQNRGGHAEGARTETRRVLDEFETRYSLPSECLMEVFLGPDGHVDESADFHAWDSACGRRGRS